MSTPSTEPIGSKQPRLSGSVSLTFDGELLTLTSGSQEFVYPALSGKREIYESIPEGTYLVRARELWLCTWLRPRHPDTSFLRHKPLNRIQSGHPSSLGNKLRITLYPNTEANLKDDTHFYIDGSNEESNSCIHVFSHFGEFVGDLKHLSYNHNLTEILLFVAYDHKARESPPPPQPAVEHIPLRLDRLKGHVPDPVIAELKTIKDKFGITTNLRLAHFLAHCMHESGGFQNTTENLNYSEKRLKKVFPKKFILKKKSAKTYAGNPEKIGSFIYASRLGNADEQSGEGFKYRGRGYIQLTGKSNYHAFAKFMGDGEIVTHPDKVATHYPLASAAYFFHSKKLWNLCDRGFSDKVILSVTKKVNGGTIGLLDRMKNFKKLYKLLHEV